MNSSEGKKLIRSTEEKKQSDDKDEDLLWGWGKIKPRCLQRFNNDKWFIVSLLIFNIFQVMNGAFTFGSIPTLEKQFNLSSKMSGLIAAANDITGLILMPFVSHFGETRHKPRWLGIGALVSMLGSLTFILPQFVARNTPIPTDGEMPVGNISSSQLCFGENVVAKDATECEGQTLSNTMAYAIFFVARLLMGAGSTPIFSLGVSFIDDNSNPSHTSIYLGLFYSSIFVATSLGFLIQGMVLGKVYVDFTLPEELKGITQNHPLWIGNWWSPFFMNVLMLLFSGIMLLGFPKELPGTSARKKAMIEKGELRPSESSKAGGLKGLAHALLKLLSNATYVTQTFAKILIAAFWAGLVPFMFKIMQQNFGPNARDTGIGLAMLTGPGLAGGILVGSFISSKLRLKESLQKAAKWCFILQFAGLISGLPWLIPGCEVVTFAGVTEPYYNRSLPVPENILSICNSACGCNPEVYDPVCGADAVTYYSPCHAGCSTKLNQQTFTNCSCIAPSHSQTASRGICDRNCKNFFIFVAVTVANLILAQLNNIPGQVVLLRSVPENYRSLGLGLQPIFAKIFGNLPGPLIFGYFIDNTCLLWSTSCGQTGNCLQYEIKDLIQVIFIGSIAVQVVSWILLFISWTLSKRINDNSALKSKEEVHLEEFKAKKSLVLDSQSGVSLYFKEDNNSNNNNILRYNSSNLQVVSCF